MSEFRTISVRVHPEAHEMYRVIANYHDKQGKKVWAWVEEMVQREHQRVQRLQQKDTA